MVFRVLSLVPGIRHFLEDARKPAAQKLYAVLVEQARAPVFYADLGVPDSVEGRFEMLSLHVYLILRRFSQAGQAEIDFGQVVFDIMFDDMDASLREMGVGDTVVGKKVRGLAESFYGRRQAYEGPLNDRDAAALVDALSRNVYEMENAPGASVLADYVVRLDEALEAQPVEEIVGAAPNLPPILGKDLK